MAKSNFEYRKHPDHKKHLLKKAIAWSAALVYMIVAVGVVNMNTSEFKASIISTKSVPAFNGTVSPIQQSPNWVAFNTSDYNLSYSQLGSNKLVSAPLYDPNQLRTKVASLTWGNSAHDAIRNAKITYSVAYMGNYKLDGEEYAGSHLAVDLKLPMGTPIYAIANGQVTKAVIQGGGFGNHIVIKHPNVPTYDNESRTETLHSSYSHMKSLNVKEGEIVNKGEVIGYSGDSGLSTTPHLHFQIDRDTAPWHPYWPFTSKQASDAGLSFTEAVNQGLNQADAIAKTVNPMMYVQKYKNGSVSVSIPTSTPTTTITPATTSTPPDPVSTPTLDAEPVVEPVVETIDTSNIESIRKNARFKLITPDTFIKNEPFEIKVKAVDRNGNTYDNYTPGEALRIVVSRGEAGVSPLKLTSRDFSRGVGTIQVTPKSENPLQLQIKGQYTIKESKVMLEGSNNTLFADISNLHPNFEAIKFLKDEGVIQGYPDGSFKPTTTVSRVEVIKFILEGIDADLKTARSLSFKDTDKSEWYGNYLYTAMDLDIVQGYPDGSFKPTAGVNKVEFLKMLITAMNIDINPNNNMTRYSDVDRNEWYAPYVKFAVDKNIIEVSGSRFKPTEVMQRDQVAEAIYRVKVLTETGSSQYTASLGEEYINNAG